jgi:hypothetical protein
VAIESNNNEDIPAYDDGYFEGLASEEEIYLE